MYESGFIKGKPYHMYIGDKIMSEEEYRLRSYLMTCGYDPDEFKLFNLLKPLKLKLVK